MAAELPTVQTAHALNSLADIAEWVEAERATGLGALDAVERVWDAIDQAGRVRELVDAIGGAVLVGFAYRDYRHKGRSAVLPALRATDLPEDWETTPPDPTPVPLPRGSLDRHLTAEACPGGPPVVKPRVVDVTRLQQPETLALVFGQRFTLGPGRDVTLGDMTKDIAAQLALKQRQKMAFAAGYARFFGTLAEALPADKTVAQHFQPEQVLALWHAARRG